jgi:hypothetical protein
LTRETGRMKANSVQTARLATIDQLIENILPNFISPVPCRETLRDWFDDAKVSRFKANPLAERGGGPVWYSVADVEKFFRNRTLPGGAR